ncbi:helix-turn-helix domain-containing protein [Variovorax gossypii]
MDTEKHESKGDWHPADVVAALRKRGTSLRKVAIANGYSHIQRVLTSSWVGPEKLVAQALGVSPEVIWPSRYQEGVSREHAERLTRNRRAVRAIRTSRSKEAK